MGATDSRYTPVAEDIGYELIAEVGYTDGHGPGKKALSPLPVPPKVVVDVPSAPGNLQAAPRDRSVLLTWESASDNGSALTRYEYQQSTDGGTTWSPGWTTIALPADTDAADLTEHTVTGLTNGTVYTFEVRAVNAIGEGAAAQVTLPPENLRARWVLDGLDIFADHKVTLTWDDPGDTRITGWDTRRKAGSLAWEGWQEISGSGATTVTHTVEGVKMWRAHRFKVRPRYGTFTGAEPEVMLSPPSHFRQLLSVKPRGGAGKAQFEVGFDLSDEDEDLPESAYTVPSDNVRYQLVTVSATGVTTTSDFVTLANISRLLPAGASLVATFSPTDLAPVEGLAGGASETQAAAFRQAATLRITGLDPGVTYQIKMRLVASDGATISESTSGSVLGLRWQRPTAPTVELTWMDPDDPAIAAWQYRQQAGTGSWGLWQSVPNSTASTTSHTVSSLDAEETYRFQVGAIGPGGLVAESFTVSAAPKPLVAPGNLRAVPGHASMTLRWDDANNARLTGWQYRQRQAGEDWGVWQPIPGSTASTTSYTVTDLTNGVNYRFRVRGVTSNGGVVLTWPMVETSPDGSLSSPPFPVRVSLTNIDEAGTVILPSSPQEGLAFTAALTDPDGDVSARHEEGNPDDGDGDGWVFERRDGNGRWQLIPSQGGASGAVSSLPELKSYTPTAADVGRSEPRTSRYTRRCDICCACGLGASEST